ncbi:unnamed protein product [Agarophyton chilense]|eukprot:gb/GEZJ01001179.1/.p1 GENE.gb/GEZJ01001179.1/~~gb/GEZJ01001179.1/.p1  ORF type:complete len:609 (-),score=93.58 gb/GEZJ01001179.1/:2181-4007(-)
MSENTTTSLPTSVDREESYSTALTTIINRTQTPVRQSTEKMFMITDTSPASPLIKRRPLHSSYGKRQEGKQIESPVSYTSAITQSPAVSQSASSNDTKTVKNRVTFDSFMANSSTSIALEHSDSFTPNTNSNTQEQPVIWTPKTRTTIAVQAANISVIPLSTTQTNQILSAKEGEVVEFETNTTTAALSSTRKPRKSITEGFTPPPSKIPTRKRRTPSYARSTKASRRRSDWTKMSAVQMQSREHESVRKARKLNFSKTIPVSPEVLHRNTGRIRKIPSPKKSRSFKPNPSSRYLNRPCPVVRPTVKSKAAPIGRAQTVPVCSPPSFEMSKPERTASKPFKLGSVELHGLRMKQIQARRKMEEEEDRRRRIIHPIELHHEILRGPTFVPNLENKVLTVPFDPVPWVERRERTLAFEATQRERIKEMDAMKEQAEKMREIAQEERLREEYERKRFRPRPIPRSHYKPDTPPKRRASIAVMQMKEQVAQALEAEIDDELQSYFSNLAISEDTQTTYTPTKQDEKIGRSVSLKPADRKDLYSIVEQEHNAGVPIRKGETVMAKTAISGADKENVMPSSLETPEVVRKKQKQPNIGPMRLFHEIRNTLFGRF